MFGEAKKENLTGTGPWIFKGERNTYTIDKNGLIDESSPNTDGSLTLGDVYTPSMRGQKIGYESQDETDWIVLGKNSDGKILITTLRPSKTELSINPTAENWLRYEEILDNACFVWGLSVMAELGNERSWD